MKFIYKPQIVWLFHSEPGNDVRVTIDYKQLKNSQFFFVILNRLLKILKVCKAERHWKIFKEMAAKKHLGHDHKKQHFL